MSRPCSLKIISSSLRPESCQVSSAHKYCFSMLQLQVQALLYHFYISSSTIITQAFVSSHSFRRHERRSFRIMSQISLSTFFAKILTPVPKLERNDDPPCAICKGPFHRPVRTTCNHTFCLAGILSWLDYSTTCPTCRRPLFHARRSVPNNFPGSLTFSFLPCRTRSQPGDRTGSAIRSQLSDTLNPRSPPLSPSSLSFTRFLSDNPLAPLSANQRVRFNARILLSAADRAMLHLKNAPCAAICKHEWRMVRNLLAIFFRASAGIIVYESAVEFQARLRRLLQYSPRWEHRYREITVLSEEMSKFGELKEVLIDWIVKRAARLSDVHSGLTTASVSIG